MNKVPSADSNSTLVAVRQSPRANQAAKSGILPTLPAPVAIGIPPSSSRTHQASTATIAPIDDGNYRLKSNVSTNPFAQTPAFGANSLSSGAQHSTEALSSNPFATSSHSGMK